MNLQVCPLASGSSGNAIYVSCGKHSILIDCGISGVQLEKNLKSIGANCRDLDGIILTHEHSDHSKGVGILSRRFSLPVYTRPGTWLAGEKTLGPIAGKLERELENGLTFGQMEIEYFDLPHDAQEHVGLQIHWRGKKVLIATDLGQPTARLKKYLPEADIIVIEANHDLSMLENGRYPRYLKNRIASNHGHLSNDTCGELLAESLTERPVKIYLAHLSSENNDPQVARLTVENCLEYEGISLGEHIQLSVARRDCASEIFELS